MRRGRGSDVRHWTELVNNDLQRLGPLGPTYVGVGCPELLYPDEDDECPVPPLGATVKLCYESGKERFFGILTYEHVSRHLQRPLWVYPSGLPLLITVELTPETIRRCIADYLSREAFLAVYDGQNRDIYDLYRLPVLEEENARLMRCEE